ncbi:MAG: 2-oxoacid:acceptor oxidoreductase family protein, partial [Candidatus Omnitrophica bacterium]|nr:2-oxoacid:acceptor oxidoreductase family protein [Candidatus Omnitrophota bacterium]
NIGNDTDLILAAHEVVLSRRLDDEETNRTCQVLLDIGDKPANEEAYEEVLKRAGKMGIKVFPFETSADAQEIIKGLSGKGKNLYYLGMLSAIYNMPKEALISEINLTFGKKLKEEIFQKNIALFEYGYRDAQTLFPISYYVKENCRPVGEDSMMIDGNSALSLGIIDAGIKLYSGYPITPASSVMHTLAKLLPSYGGMVHQAEDEIAAIGAAIGAYFGGVPSATGTSGPGLSLKQEFIGYASVAEIPLVILDVQRSGPSTGMPTKTEQSDLPAVIFGSHGDNTKIVISVSNVIDCFYAPQMARYLAEKLRLPVFILSDFLTANSYKVIKKLQANQVNSINDVPDFVFERFHIKRLPDNIEMVRTIQADPGTPGQMRRVTGLNTDEKGSVNYFSGANQRSHRIRNQKVHHVARALTVPEMFGKTEGADILVIGWGSSRGVIEEAITNGCKQGMNIAGMHFRIVHPLPLMLKDIFKKFKKVVTVEGAYGDDLKFPPLAMLLRAETLMEIKPIICQATGRPIRPRGILEKINETLKASA